MCAVPPHLSLEHYILRLSTLCAFLKIRISYFTLFCSWVKEHVECNVDLEHHIKAFGGVEVYFHSFLTITPDGVSNQLHAAVALFSLLIVLETWMNSGAGVDAFESKLN